MAASPSILSTFCAVLTSLAFLLGAQSRLTNRFTPALYEEQYNKTAESQGAIYRRLGISAGAMNAGIGIVNLFIVVGLLYPATRVPTVGVAELFMCLGLRGRWISGRSIIPPLITQALLAGAAFL